MATLASGGLGVKRLDVDRPSAGGAALHVRAFQRIGSDRINPTYTPQTGEASRGCVMEAADGGGSTNGGGGGAGSKPAAKDEGQVRVLLAWGWLGGGGFIRPRDTPVWGYQGIGRCAVQPIALRALRTCRASTLSKHVVIYSE